MGQRIASVFLPVTGITISIHKLLQEAKLQKMTKMSRRAFLTGVSALVASAGALCALPKISNAQDFPDVELPFVTSQKRAIAYGRQLGKSNFMRNVIIAADSHGENNEYLDLRFVIAPGKIEGPITLFIDDKNVPINDDGNASNGEFSGLAHMETSWLERFTDGKQYTGVDLRLKWCPVKFVDGIPNIRFG